MADGLRSLNQMKGLEPHEQVFSLRRLLAHVLNSVRPEFRREGHDSGTIGDLVRLYQEFLGEELARDVFFALGIRNRLEYVQPPVPTPEEIERAAYHLRRGIERFCEYVEPRVAELAQGTESTAPAPTEDEDEEIYLEVYEPEEGESGFR